MITQEPGRILVVDDNEINRDLLERWLRRRGHEVELALDGAEAMLRLRAASFDLVVLDIMMPVMDGYEVLAQMQADERLRSTPVIVVSALDELDSVVRCIELGAEDYLLKPINAILLGAKIGACLEKKRLRDYERARLAAARQELELGRRAQADFLPGELPLVSGWELAAAFYPAREVAGDFYDAIRLPQGWLGLVIGDVCDKGVGAALFMALARSLVRAFAEQAGPDPERAMGAVALTDEYLVRHHRRSHTYLTLFFGLLDPASGRLAYINAGHPGPVIRRRDGRLEVLEATGPAIGLMPEGRFITVRDRLEPGDVLLAYTDGTTEARDATGALLGEQQLLAALRGASGDVADMLRRAVAAVHAHAGHGPLEDDITLLAISRLA